MDFKRAKGAEITPLEIRACAAETSGNDGNAMENEHFREKSKDSIVNAKKTLPGAAPRSRPPAEVEPRFPAVLL